MRLSLIVSLLLMLCTTPGVYAEPQSDVQGDSILKELKEIRKLLQSIDKKSIPTSAAKPKKPTTATVSTLGNPVLGDVNAPITLVEFTDYQCPFVCVL